jgi:hypothetical protein
VALLSILKEEWDKRRPVVIKELSASSLIHSSPGVNQTAPASPYS